MKQRNYLLPQEGMYYKANLHSHTIFSDGTLTPEESKQAYQEQGYQIIAFTDHRTYQYHKELNDENFLTIAGYEVDINENRFDSDWQKEKTYHINLYDTNPEEEKEKKQQSILPESGYFDINSINQYIKEMNELGFLACYNHPYWSMQTYDDYKQLEGFFAMEIYNYGCELDGLYGYNPQAYDEILRLGKRWFCLATDDNHNRAPFGDSLCDSFGGFTMIKAKQFTYASIIEALKNGHFYSSMGPEIKELYIEENKLVVKTSPVEKIYVILEGRDCYKKIAKKGDTITEAIFTLTGKETYLRVQCRDTIGQYANSNAYFFTK